VNSNLHQRDGFHNIFAVYKILNKIPNGFSETLIDLFIYSFKLYLFFYTHVWFFQNKIKSVDAFLKIFFDVSLYFV